MIFTGIENGYLRLAHAIVSGEPHGNLRCAACGRSDLVDVDFAHSQKGGRDRWCLICRSDNSSRWHLRVRKVKGTVTRGARDLPAHRRRNAMAQLVKRRGFLPGSEVLARVGAPAGVEHGTAAGYSSGCRCEPCREARKAYKREWRASRRAAALRRAS